MKTGKKKTKQNKNNAAVGVSVFVVSEVWRSDTAVTMTTERSLLRRLSGCAAGASLFLSFFLDLRHYETWTTPAENKDSAFSFISTPPHPPNEH